MTDSRPKAPAWRVISRILRAHWPIWLAAGGLAILVIVVDPRQLIAAIDRVRATSLLLMAILVIASMAMRGMAWRGILRGQGISASVRTILEAQFAAQTMVLMPASDLARARLLRRMSKSAREKHPGEIAATIVLDEICFLFVLSVAAIPRAILALGPSLLVLGIVIGFVLLFAVMVFEPAFSAGLRVIGVLRPLRRWNDELRKMRSAFTRLLSARILAEVALFDGLAVILAILLLKVAADAVDGGGVPLEVVAFALAIGNVAGGVSFVPIGLGVFEGSVTLMLMSAGMAAGPAAAAGLVYRAFSDVFMAFVGAAVALGIRGGRTRLRSMQPSP